MSVHVAIPLVIFALAYLVIALGRIPPLSLDRTGAALVGAIAMVIAGPLTERAAEAAVDFRTLGLLLGMMIVVANLRLSGAFTLAARTMLARAGSGFGLLAVTVVVSGVLAAFFINDIVCLALTPLLIEAAAAFETDPVPLLLGLATASNIGSAATITGNPQNMIVAGFAHLRYSRFALHLAPPAAIALVIDYGVIAFVYRNSLATVARRAAARSSRPRIVRPLAIKSTVVALGALVCFALGFETDLVALAAGAVLLFTRRIRPERIYGLVDWTMLVMFAGLFIVVAGVEATGLQNEIIRVVGVSRLANPVVLTAVTGLLSNLVSNVPAVLLFRPLYPLLGAGEKTALVLASASTLAGNLTVVGSIANLIVFEQARRHRIEITFWEHLRVGVPVTLITMVVTLFFLGYK